VPIGLDEDGMPRAVQVAAPLYRDDLAFRAARAIEKAASLPLAQPPETGQMRAAAKQGSPH
jgi:aspartyl-tRNA(Asn)/glutamyl-tRNA(Gln) amidotransferase subunit A